MKKFILVLFILTIFSLVKFAEGTNLDPSSDNLAYFRQNVKTDDLKSRGDLSEEMTSYSDSDAVNNFACQKIMKYVRENFEWSKSSETL